MVKIEQVRLLEQRVQKVIGRISELQQENHTLRSQLQTYQDRISDLEARIDGFASTQEEIEAGILSALQRLDEVEDAVGEDEGTEDLTIAAESSTDPAPDVSDEAKPEDGDDGNPQESPAEAEAGGSETAEPEAGGPELDIF